MVQMFHVTLKQLYCMDHVQYKINIYIMITDFCPVFGLIITVNSKGTPQLCNVIFKSQVERQHYWVHYNKIIFACSNMINMINDTEWWIIGGNFWIILKGWGSSISASDHLPTERCKKYLLTEVLYNLNWLLSDHNWDTHTMLPV